jgi:hypothetical protein
MTVVIARLLWAAPQAKPIWVLGEKAAGEALFQGFFSWIASARQDFR